VLELRLERDWPWFGGRMCYTDIWFLDHESSEGAACQCDSDIPSPRVCFENKYYSCGCIAETDLFPLTDSRLLGKVSVRVPHNPSEVLRRLYPSGIGIKNMATVPENPLFEDNWSIVIANSSVARPRTHRSAASWWIVIAIIVALLICAGVLVSYRLYGKRRSGYGPAPQTDDDLPQFVIGE
ncbi:hypothetical protein FOZ62_003099, partial [Perkinsus olseni]